MPLSYGYARVSNREQAENSHALEQQIARLKAAGAEEILSDVETGTNDDRRNFQLLLELVRQGKAKEVVITRIDRLSRSLGTLKSAIAVFQKHNCNLRALDDAIDLSTAAGKFHVNMLGALAEMESDRLSERVLHGWHHLRSKSVAMNPPFGYRKESDRHALDIEPFLCLLDTQEERSRAQVAREFVDEFLRVGTLRLTLRSIYGKYGIRVAAHTDKAGHKRGGRVAQKLFRFSVAGLSNWLSSPVLRGHTCYLRKERSGIRKRKSVAKENWIIVRDTHPAIMSEAEWLQIESRLATNSKMRGQTSTAAKYPLSGLIFCGECRSSMYSCTGRKNYRHPERGYNYYFQCKNWRSRGCSQGKTIRMDKAEEFVIDAIAVRADSLALLIPQKIEDIEINPEVEKIRNQLQKIEQIITDFGDDDGLMGKQYSILKNRLVVLDQKPALSVMDGSLRRELLALFSDRRILLSSDHNMRRKHFHQFIDRVVVLDGEAIEVVFKN